MNLSNSLKSVNIVREVKVFDKHKSWYKLDINGEYITKNQIIKPTAVNKKRKKRPRMQTAVIYPESVAKTHQFILKMALHTTITFLLLLIAYSGFAFFTPGSMDRAAGLGGLVEDVGGPVLELVLEKS